MKNSASASAYQTGVRAQMAASDGERGRTRLPPAHVGQEGREIEEGRHRIHAPGDPRDALGLHRQHGEHRRRAAAARERRQPEAEPRDRHHQQRVGGVDGDVDDVVQLRPTPRPNGGDLIRERQERTDLVRRVAPDVVHPRHDEPPRKVVHGRLATASCDDAEVVLDEVVVERREVRQHGREHDQDDAAGGSIPVVIAIMTACTSG